MCFVNRGASSIGLGGTCWRWAQTARPRTRTGCLIVHSGAERGQISEFVFLVSTILFNHGSSQKPDLFLWVFDGFLKGRIPGEKALEQIPSYGPKGQVDMISGNMGSSQTANNSYTLVQDYVRSTGTFWWVSVDRRV